MAGNWPTSKDDNTSIGARTKVNVKAITDQTKQYDATHFNAMGDSFIAMQTSMGVEGSALSGILFATTTDTSSIRYRLEGRMISRYGGSEPATLQRILTASTLANASSLLLEIGHTATTMDSFVQLFRVNFSAANVRGYVPARYGGTDQTLYAVGDMLSADTTLTLSRVAAVATGSVLTSAGVSTLPAWTTTMSIGAATFTVASAGATVDTALTIVRTRSDGAGAAGIGVRLLMRAESATEGTVNDACALDAVFTTATAGSASGDLVVNCIAGGTLAERLRITSAGYIVTVAASRYRYGTTGGFVEIGSSYAYLASPNGSRYVQTDNTGIDCNGELRTASAAYNIGTTGTRWGTTYTTALNVSAMSTQTGGRQVGRRAVADSNDTSLITDTVIAYTSITAARVVTLIAAATAGIGFCLEIKDESGSCSGGNTITIDGNGAETINGAATQVINTAYGSAMLYCNGSNWFLRTPLV